MRSIRGVVVRDGRPLAGAYVRLGNRDGGFVAEIYTKGDGAFAFYVFDGAWHLEARSAGCAPLGEHIVVSGTDSIVTLNLDARVP